MRVHIRSVTAAAMLLCAGKPAAAQGVPAAAQSAPGTAASAGVGEPADASEEIVVTGRRDSEKHRLPPEFRTAQSDRGDRWRQTWGQDFSCRNVGPRGCPLQPNRILTVRSDGSIVWGERGVR